VNTPIVTESDADIPEAGNEDAEEIAAPAVQPAVKKDLPVDELIDCVVPLEFDHPVKGEKICRNCTIYVTLAKSRFTLSVLRLTVIKI
jgi:hypothetical protein